MRVWITKYALTTGIMEADASINHSISETMITVRSERYPQHFHGNDWHQTRAAAIARADQMRKAKIASLKKSVAKFEALRFE